MKSKNVSLMYKNRFKTSYMARIFKLCYDQSIWFLFNSALDILSSNGYITGKGVLTNILPSCNSEVKNFTEKKGQKISKKIINIYYIINVNV